MIKKTNLLVNNHPGQILIIGIIFLAVVLIISATLFSKVASFLRFGSNTILREQAVNVAEAGIDRALWQLNVTTGSYTGETNTPIGSTGTFTVTVVNKTGSLKTITSTGYIPNSANPKSKQTIKTDVLISNDVVAFNYGVQVGQGGFNINGGSTINGSVYSNANIVGDGGSTIDGDAYAVGTITNQTWDLLVTGTKYPGSPSVTMPTIDYQEWKDVAEAGGTTTCSPTCTLGYQGGNIGPRKYSGNLTINGGGDYTVQGPIWVTGNLSVTGGGKLRLAESFGSNETVMVVDGTISISGGAQIYSTSANPKGYLLLGTTSTSSSALTLSGGTQSSIFYVLNGTASVSGGVRLTAVVAKQLSMSGGTVLTYDIGLASSQFSSGPGGAWVVKKGTYRFTSSP